MSDDNPRSDSQEFADSRLQEIFGQYRAAFPDREPGPNFMPMLWQKIEARRSLWFSFSRLGRDAVTVSAVLCLLLLAMNFAAPPEFGMTYTDALISDGGAEQVAYTDVLHPSVPVLQR